MTEEVIDDYEERYIAFVDLLGFKQKVAAAENKPSERVMLREILSVVKDTLGENPYIGFRRNYFSDCIIYSAKRTPEGLYEMFEATGLLTLNLLQYDVMVRGGLTAGGTHHSRDFVYGTAVNRAVLIERDAKNPMTMVSEEIVEDAKKYGPQQHQWIAHDPSGKSFVHFLISYAVYRHEPIWQGKMILDRPGGRIIDFVCQRLNRDTGSVLEKAQWLQNYWNHTVAVHGTFKAIEAGVTGRYDSGGPVIGQRRMYMPNPQQQPNLRAGPASGSMTT